MVACVLAMIPSCFALLEGFNEIIVSGDRLSYEKIPIKEIDGKVIVRVPERFWRFHNLERKHRMVSMNGDNLLITIV